MFPNENLYLFKIIISVFIKHMVIIDLTFINHGFYCKYIFVIYSTFTWKITYTLWISSVFENRNLSLYFTKQGTKFIFIYSWGKKWVFHHFSEGSGNRRSTDHKFSPENLEFGLEAQIYSNLLLLRSNVVCACRQKEGTGSQNRIITI